MGMAGAVAALADTLFPAISLRLSLARDFSSSAAPLLRLQALHPLAALLASGYVVWVIVGSSTGQYRSSQRASVTIILFFLQAGIGALNVVLLTLVWLQISHLLVADLLGYF
jgi:cytochrome c oxidase assembly protein subunit 15